MLLLHTALAQNNGVNLKTTFENGFFETEAYIEIAASQDITDAVIAEIATRFRRIEIDSLEWLLKGLSGNEEGKNLIRIDYAGGKYNPTTQIIDIFMNIHVGKTQFNDVQTSVLMTSDNKTFVDAKMQNNNFFMKSANGTLYVIKTENNVQFVIKASVSFGWFFNIFVTKSTYSSVAEWRIKTVLNNIHAEIERKKLPATPPNR